MNMFQPSVKLQKTIRKGSRKQRIYDKPQTPLDRLLASKHIEGKKCEELISLREQMDPFLLSETVNQKLQCIWDLAHYRYQPPNSQEKTSDQPEGLSPVEREMLEGLSQAFGIKVYIRTRKGGELVALHHG